MGGRARVGRLIRYQGREIEFGGHVHDAIWSIPPLMEIVGKGEGACVNDT